jgi:hypothetical protein
MVFLLGLSTTPAGGGGRGGLISTTSLLFQRLLRLFYAISKLGLPARREEKEETMV